MTEPCATSVVVFEVLCGVVRSASNRRVSSNGPVASNEPVASSETLEWDGT